MNDALQALFREVADMSPSSRARHFEAHSVPADLRAEVESLLQFDTRSPLPYANSVAGLAADVVRLESEPAEGERCGPYTLIRPLGRGGMGTVFLAQRMDGEVEQRVAIKVVSNQTSSTFHERFLQERQILASLQHPGIARLLDAGRTASGRPYLVMEYVEGTAIDDYAAKLSVRDILALFLRVCDALSYAHRNLIIHRDVKPGNILVDAAGQPRLLDFGIARMLDDASEGGLTRERMLTPDYASPEQVRGTAHSTATDIYSAGAVLYKLLAGKSPHLIDPGDARTLEHVTGSRDPAPPSTVNPNVPRDLDFIVARAMRDEANERYPSIAAFADDVRAFLESRPVQARSGNAWYATRKFLRRRWLPASAVTAVVVSLSLGLYIANRERQIAERRFLQLRQLANKLLSFDDDLQLLPGATKTRQKIVAASLEYLDGLGRDARDDQDLAIELANGYLALAQVQGVPTFSNLGQFAAAAESLRKAEDFLERALAKDRTRPDALLTAAEVEQDLMILSDSQQQKAEELIHTARAADYVEKLFDGHPSTEQIRDALPIYSNVGLSYMNQHHLDEAIRVDRRTVELARTVSDRRLLASALSLSANALRLSGDVEGALALIQEARQVAETTPYPTAFLKGITLYGVLMRQGQILGGDETISLNRPAEAIEPFRKAYDQMDQQAAQDPNDQTSRDRVAEAARQLADIVRNDDPGRALAIYDRGIERQREVKGNVKARREEALLLAHSSYPLRALGRRSEARQRIDKAFDLLRASGDYPAAQLDPNREVVSVLRARGDFEADGGDTAAAVATYRETLDKVLASRPDVEHDFQMANAVGRLYLAFARSLKRLGEDAASRALDDQRLNLWRAWDRKLPNNQFVRRQLDERLDTGR
jgi:serine/threonine protein kinase